MALDIVHRLMLKQKATEWVDLFWASLVPPTEELKAKFEELEQHSDLIDDKVMIKMNIENGYNNRADLHIFERFGLFTTWLTPKAIYGLSKLVKRMGDVIMLAAAIIHLHRPIDLTNSHIVAWEWLRDCVFDGQYPNTDMFAKMWDKQKLVDMHGFDNLVDVIFAFELLTAEECEFVERQETKETK